MTWGAGASIWAGIADAIVSASGPSASLTVSAYTTNSAGAVSSTLFGGFATNAISGSTTTSISNVFPVAAGTVPSSGYIEVTLTAPTTSWVMISWGNGLPTDFQVNFTYS
jgi:outer membrane lipoprotein SlyB